MHAKQKLDQFVPWLPKGEANPTTIATATPNSCDETSNSKPRDLNGYNNSLVPCERVIYCLIKTQKTLCPTG